MKRIFLVTAACLSLSVPALAQNRGDQPKQPQQQMQNQGQNHPRTSNAAAGNQQQAQMIEPSRLSRQEVRDIQTNLNKDGFKVKRVDGRWGKNTAQALKSFQQAKNLPGKGQLNQQTLAALGVNAKEPQTVGSSRRPAHSKQQ